VTDALPFVPAPVLSAITTIEGFAYWMYKLVAIETWGLCGAPPVYINATAIDLTRNKMLIYGVFEFAPWVDILTFDVQTCKITNVTKVWNDGWTIANDPGPPPGCAPDPAHFPTFPPTAPSSAAAAAAASLPSSSIVPKQQARAVPLSASCTPALMESNAQAFFVACESGEGWNGTMAYVTSEQATFHADVTDAFGLAPVSTIWGYTEWMAAVVVEFGPAATFTIDAKGLDEARRTMMLYAVFGGFSDYVYVLEFEAQTCRIDHMRKVWNDGYANATLAGGRGR
jgi:hypothetical protein